MKSQKAIPQIGEQQKVVLPGTPEEQIAKERTKQVELNQVRAAQKAAGETGESARRKYDVNRLFLAENDPRKPPAWLPRAILMVMVAIFLGIFIYQYWGNVEGLFVNVIICLFIALAMEPAVAGLVRHGWKRSVAALSVWFAVLIVVGILVAMFGSMFVQQVTGLISGIPHLYSELASFVRAQFDYQLPAFNALGNLIAENIQTSWITDILGSTAGAASWLMEFGTSLMVILFVTYYFSAGLPNMRRSICSWLPQRSQRRFLVVWSVIEGQVSSFLSSRVILAVISAICMGIYMRVTDIPYWLPLAMMYAIISQFVPMVGGIIGAILPVIVAWSDQGIKAALLIVVYTLIYQQIENMLIAPKIQENTMAVHPAVGLVAVFAFSNLFGLLGALLALPVVASVQVVMTAYLQRQELVDSTLLDVGSDKVAKSKLARSAQLLSQKLTDQGRVVRSTSGRIITATDLQILKAEKQFADYSEENSEANHERDFPGHPFMSAEELDATETVALAKRSAGSLRAQWRKNQEAQASPDMVTQDLMKQNLASASAHTDEEHNSGDNLESTSEAHR